jgi:hypothetical protein
MYEIKTCLAIAVEHVHMFLSFFLAGNVFCFLQKLYLCDGHITLHLDEFIINIGESQV